MSTEARIRTAVLLAALVPALGAGYRTENFVVTAPTQALAREIALSAEQFRRELALQWLERELPRWSQPCPIVAHVRQNLGAGGRTSFMFRNRQPFGWEMEIQGSRQRILDSVLPHEITHTIFATHFGQPLPRWADEGACTTVEHPDERRKQEQWLIRFLKTERGIPFNHLFAMTEYPGDILPLYSQGYSLARFLIAQGGKPRYVQFIGRGLDTGNWPAAVKDFYGFASLGQLQLAWLDWVKQGSREELLASGRPASRGVRPKIDQSVALATATGEHEQARRPGGNWYVRRPQVDPPLAPSARPGKPRH